MSDSLHLLIPGAAVPGGGQRHAGDPVLPPLPNLQALLARMAEERVIEADDDSPADPFEMALARARGLPDAPGRTPWAACETQTTGTACAWLMPVHLEAGMNDVRLSDPADMQVSPEQSRALMQACAPLLAQDGMTLHGVRPDAWLARGDLLDGLTCWSPRRAAGRSLTPEQLLRADDPARQGALLRLVNELQMLLYAHPVNDARERAGLLTINALWMHGAGRLTQPVPPAPGISVASNLLRADPGRAEAWQALDAGLIAEWLARVQSNARSDRKNGNTVRLTLCGPRRARTWAAMPRGSWRTWTRWLRPVSVAAVLEKML